MDEPVPVRKLLITGANGFIGRHLVTEALARGLDVCPATRSGGEVAGVSSVAVGQVDGDTDWSGALKGVTHVIHLAGRAHVLDETSPDPADAFMRVNAGGTRSLAAAARAAGVRRFVLVSSISVYDPALVHLAEGTHTGPTTDYGRSKLAAEQALLEEAGNEMDTVIFRPPLVYGPGVGGNFLRLLRLAASGWPLPLGAVRNRRSLIHVRNLADAFLTELDGDGARNRTFLVSDGEDLSTPFLLSRLAAGMGRKARLWRLPASFLAAASRLVGKGREWEKLAGTLTLDTTAFHEATGWAPPCRPAEGLAETARWYCDTMPGAGDKPTATK